MTLRAARVNKGLSIKEVAAALKVNPSTVYSWEQGRNEPSAKAFVKLCKLYGQPCDNIFLP